jgi:hypothetical protein
MDFRTGIEKADPQHALAMIFDLYQLAIGGGQGEPQNLPGINPGMAGDDAVGFTWPQQDSGQLIHN